MEHFSEKDGHFERQIESSVVFLKPDVINTLGVVDITCRVLTAFGKIIFCFFIISYVALTEIQTYASTHGNRRYFLIPSSLLRCKLVKKKYFES